ncbi:hypothetical protein FKM82_020770 [Ascaphus truei]
MFVSIWALGSPSSGSLSDPLFTVVGYSPIGFCAELPHTDGLCLILIKLTLGVIVLCTYGSLLVLAQCLYIQDTYYTVCMTVGYFRAHLDEQLLVRVLWSDQVLTDCRSLVPKCALTLLLGTHGHHLLIRSLGICLWDRVIVIHKYGRLKSNLTVLKTLRQRPIFEHKLGDQRVATSSMTSFSQLLAILRQTCVELPHTDRLCLVLIKPTLGVIMLCTCGCLY